MCIRDRSSSAPFVPHGADEDGEESVASSARTPSHAPTPHKKADGAAKSAAGDAAAAGARGADDDTDDGVEWFQGWDANHARHFYFHRPTGSSQWVKPSAPFKPHRADEDDEESVASSARTPGHAPTAADDAAAPPWARGPAVSYTHLTLPTKRIV